MSPLVRELRRPPVKGGSERAFRERGVAFSSQKTNPQRKTHERP